MPDKQLGLRRARARYALDQCGLYKLTTKTKLFERLGLRRSRSLDELLVLPSRYRVFELPEAVCEFTGKVTRARRVQESIGDLKLAQARIANLLGRVSLPEYCHGASAGRSYRTNAAAHVEGTSVATFDIKAFFPSTPYAKVFSFFRETLRCAPDVAEILAGMCCFEGVLPTGAPSSPIVSFYANGKLFAALNELAKSLGLTFTVYIDDLTFSGPTIPAGFAWRVKRIVGMHGHRLAVGKTKFFGPGRQAHVTGTVIEGGEVRVPHSRFKKVRAIRKARAAAPDPHRRLELSRKLSGLLGEAAHLDSRYDAMAKKSYLELSTAVEAAKAAPATP